MEKKIKISARFDMQEFDRQLRGMRDKLKELYEPSNTMRTRAENARRMERQGLAPSGFSKEAESAYMKTAKQDARELENFIRRQTQGQQKLDRAIEDRAKKLKDLKSQYQDIVKLGKEDLKMKERIAKLEESSSRLRDVRRSREQAISQALDVREQISTRKTGMARLGQAYRKGGLGGMARAGGRMLRQNPMAAVGAAGMVLGGVATAGAAVNELAQQEITAPRRMRAQQGGAVQTAGFLSRNIMQGQAMQNYYWAPENQKAMQRAMTEMQRQRKLDTFKLGITGSAISGGLANGGLGLAAGLGYGAYNFIADQRMRNRMLSMLPESMGGGYFKQRYGSQLAQELMQNFEQNRRSERQLKPFKQMGMEYFQKNFMPNLQTQRTLGLTDEELYGKQGYLQGLYGEGFTTRQGRQMTQQLVGAGASTRMARTPEQALQFVRNMDLTNAGQVMGRLSGTLGSTEKSRNATIDILAEGMRKGLDSSDYAEEQRKFASSVSQIVYQAGATGENAAERLTGGFGQFVNRRTTRGLQAAQGAYQTMQNISSSSTGIRGAIQAANIMSDEDLKKLDYNQRMSLMQMSEQRINAGGREIERMAAATGLSTEDFQKKAISVKRKQAGLRSHTQQLIDRAKEIAGVPKYLRNKETSQELENVRADIESALKAEDNATFGKMKKPELESYVNALTREQIGAAPEQGIKKKLKAEGMGRLSDVAIAGMAKSEQAGLEQFNKIKDDIRDTAEATRQMTTSARSAMEALSKLAKVIDEDATKSVEEYAEVFKQIANEMADIQNEGAPAGNWTTQQPTGGTGK